MPRRKTGLADHSPATKMVSKYRRKRGAIRMRLSGKANMESTSSNLRPPAGARPSVKKAVSPRRPPGEESRSKAMRRRRNFSETGFRSEVDLVQPPAAGRSAAQCEKGGVSETATGRGIAEQGHAPAT